MAQTAHSEELNFVYSRAAITDLSELADHQLVTAALESIKYMVAFDSNTCYENQLQVKKAIIIKNHLFILKKPPSPKYLYTLMKQIKIVMAKPK